MDDFDFFPEYDCAWILDIPNEKGLLIIKKPFLYYSLGKFLPYLNLAIGVLADLVT